MPIADSFDSDIDVAMDDLGVTVIYGSQQTMGILDAPGRDATLQAIGSVSMTDYSLQYRTTSLNPQPQPKDTVIVDGETYIVRNSTPLDDGRMTQLALKTK